MNETWENKQKRLQQEQLEAHINSLPQWRQNDIREAADLMSDAVCAWMLSKKWGIFPGLDPGTTSVTALTYIRTKHK